MELETIFTEPFTKLDINKIIAESLTLNDDVIVMLQQEQLWDGKDSEGNDLRPYYSEDPYFKTPEEADAYMKWKQKITPNPKRNPDSPNYFINGYFHGTIFPVIGEKDFFEDSNAPFADNIKAKSPNALALNQEKLDVLVETIEPDFGEIYEKQLLQ